MTRAIRVAGAAAGLLLTTVAITIAGCGPGNNGSVAPVTTTTTTQGTTQSFATISGAPMTLTSTAQAATLPAVPGVSNVGGNVMIAATGGGTALVTVASATTMTSGGGPPVLLSSIGRRGALDFSGTTITPQYYVGVTNTGNAPTTVTIPTLNLNVNVGPGQSTGLAHYDPTQPSNGFNQHCASGSGQVNTNGGTTTYTPGGGTGGTWTIYPGTTLWFAPYTYSSSSTATPTPAPQVSGIIPTPPPAPPSLSGTYVGSALQTSPAGQGSQYLQFSLTQSGSSISGTYAVLPSGPNASGSFGSLSGTVSGSTVTLSATAQFGGSCTTTLNASASGMLISGTFSSGGGTFCSGSGNFSAVAQSGSLPAITGNFSGPITDSGNGSGTLTFGVTTPGTVFSGNANVTFPSNPTSGGAGVIVGFVTSATTGEFAVIDNGGGSGQGSGQCQPFGTLTISNNGATLVGKYSNSGGGNGSNGTNCPGTGTFTISH